MEIMVASKEVIIPSSFGQKIPFKLCLFDQLTPFTYTPYIFFYSSTTKDYHDKTSHGQVSKLKQSLSETLNIYYPFSGRVKDNLLIDNFYEGVPFIVTRANCMLADFLRHEPIESLNKLLPYQPYTKGRDMNSPLFAFQANIFSCGGLALGVSVSHKIVDGLSSWSFFTTWAAISQGCSDKILLPDLEEPTIVFPPRQPFPESLLSSVDSLWFSKANYVTRRFVFGSKTISMLRKKVQSQVNKKVSRVETVTSFIWKCFMDASMKTSDGFSRPSVLLEAVNLRTRTKPSMSKTAFGNMFWWATTISNPTDSNTELHDLVLLSKEAVTMYNGDYTESLQGKEGIKTLTSYFGKLQGLSSSDEPDIIGVACWCNLGLTKLNFGWGEPFWFGVMGKAASSFRNLVVLVETKDGQGIEAWATLDAQRMSIFERNPYLLTMASSSSLLLSL